MVKCKAGNPILTGKQVNTCNLFEQSHSSHINKAAWLTDTKDKVRKNKETFLGRGLKKGE